MDFSIHVHPVAKNAVMSYINVILPVAGTIVGVLIGLFWNGRRERKNQRWEIQNLRVMLYTEVKRIHDTANIHIECFDSESRPTTGLAWIVKTPVYDAYLGKLSALSPGELATIDSLYQYLTLSAEAGEFRTEDEKQVVNRIVKNSALALTVLKIHMKTEQKNWADPWEGLPTEVNEDETDDI